MKLFYSYSATDEPLRRDLEKHLSLLKAEQLIDTWTFRNIDAGKEWEKEIDARLDGLWDEHRAVKARLRFGDREKIIKRARTEERLLRAA